MRRCAFIAMSWAGGGCAASSAPEEDPGTLRDNWPCVPELSALDGSEPVDEATMLDLLATISFPATLALEGAALPGGNTVESAFTVTAAGPAQRAAFPSSCGGSTETRLPVTLSLVLGDNDLVATLDAGLDASAASVSAIHWSEVRGPAALSEAWSNALAEPPQKDDTVELLVERSAVDSPWLTVVIERPRGASAPWSTGP